MRLPYLCNGNFHIAKTAFDIKQSGTKPDLVAEILAIKVGNLWA